MFSEKILEIILKEVWATLFKGKKITLTTKLHNQQTFGNTITVSQTQL